MRIVTASNLPPDVTWRNYLLTAGFGVAGILIFVFSLGGFLPGLLGDWSIWLLLPLGLILLGGSTWFGLQISNHRRHVENQDYLTRMLRESLDDNYIYFRNLLLTENRSIGPIDGVLLGPHGALVITVANLPGEYICEGDTWYKFSGGSNPKALESPDLYKERLQDSPSWHVIRAAREVKAWLSVRSLPQVPVQPLVVLAQGKIRSVKRPSSPIVELRSFEAYLDNNLFASIAGTGQEQITEGTLEQIAERLKS